jgi:hypothetical protein
MRTSLRLEKLIVLVLVVAVGSTGLPALAATPSASLSGRIVRAGTGSPLQGAVLKLALKDGETTFESGQADSEGQYSLSGIPSGSYDVAVETGGGLYLLSPALALSPGEQRSLSLSLQPDADEPAPKSPPDTPKPAEGDKGGKKGAEQPKAAKGKGLVHFLRTPWGGVTLVLGTAAIIGALVHSSDNSKPATASPSSN